MRTSVRTSAVVFALATLLVACSPGDEQLPRSTSDDGSGSPTAGSPASVDPTGTDPAATGRVDPREGGLDVGFGEFAITLEASEIRPGAVTFVIRNGGALVHGFEIEAAEDDDDSSGPGNGELKLEGPEIRPGGVVRIRADLPPGTYEIECFVAEHDDRGMRTTLTVTPDAPLVREGRNAPAPDQVEIAGFAFAPAELHVTRGTEVTWTNADPAAHTATTDGVFDSGTLDPGATFAFRFDDAGTFGYTCVIHPAMRGTVHVT